MPRTALSPWKAHVERWSACDGCPLSERRTNVVLARGRIPCDVLFIGEAPGRSEDAHAQPFIGPAGKLLDAMIEAALGDTPLRLAFTNLIACIPLDEENNDKLGEPPYESVMACAGRLAEFVQIAMPRLVVRVGRHAQEWLQPGYQDSIRLGWDCSFVDIVHPAFILRKPIAFQSMERQRTVIILRNAVEEL